VPCDRCHVASASVEVITGAGSLFLCEHHHKRHRDSIIAAGHQIRARLVRRARLRRPGYRGERDGRGHQPDESAQEDQPPQAVRPPERCPSAGSPARVFAGRCGLLAAECAGHAADGTEGGPRIASRKSVVHHGVIGVSPGLPGRRGASSLVAYRGLPRPAVAHDWGLTGFDLLARFLPLGET